MSRGKIKEAALIQSASSSGYCHGLLFGYELSQIAQQVVAEFREAVDFPLRVDRVLFAQLRRFLSVRRERMQVPGKASGRREKIGDLPLNCRVEQIQPIRIGFVNREFRQCESAELVKMLL